MFFRVDNRSFAEGEWIEPSGNYFKHLDCIEKCKLECFLEATRENCNTQRRDVLFLFIELKDALIFARRSGQFIYQVHPDQPLGKFDMNKLDGIFEAIKIGAEDEIIKAMCRQYWHFNKTFAPCFECLTNKAMVEKIVCERADIESFSEEFLQDNSYSVENSQTYRNLLKKVY